MGTWGVGILQNDFTLDVYGDYMALLDEGKSHAAIRAELEAQYADDLDDYDDGPRFWIALAKAQWECGALDPDVLAKVTDLIASGAATDDRAWTDPANGARHRAILTRFLHTLQTPRNPARVRRPRTRRMTGQNRRRRAMSTAPRFRKREKGIEPS